MKICFLAGASSIHTVRWVNAMADRGHEVSLITAHSLRHDVVNPRVKIYYLRIPVPIGYYFNCFKVKALIRQIKPDILHSHYASGYGTLARLVGFQPTLLSVWGSDVFDFPYKRKINEKILRRNLNAADQITSTSWVMKQQTEKFIHPSSPIEVIPFGVDLEKFKRTNLEPAKDYLVIGMVKWLEEKYGPRYLIQATALLLEKLCNNAIGDTIRLLIVGDGSQFSEMQQLVKKLKLSDITTFTGSIPNDKVPKYLNQMDIFCAPSTLNESFGVAVVEASACELPVIVSNVGGLPEVVRNEETGYIVEPRNPEQIAEKLHELVLDSVKRLKFGKQGRNFVRRHYDWQQNVSQMEQLYKKLVERHSSKK